MYYSDMLQHHGILGMKWGIRRYQNKDGSLTAEGKARQKSSTSSTSSATKTAAAATTAAAAAGTVLAGPVVGITAGVISGGVTYAISSKKKVSDLDSTSVDDGSKLASKVKNSSKSDVVKSSTESATNKSISKNGMSSKTVDYLQNTLGRDYAVNYNGTGGIKLDYHTITNSDGSKTKLSTTLSDYIGKSETSKYSSAEEMLSANGINVNEIDIYK